jgi:hypothetical protein
MLIKRAVRVRTAVGRFVKTVPSNQNRGQSSVFSSLKITVPDVGEIILGFKELVE